METENEREILRLKGMLKDTHHIEPITLFGNILLGGKFKHEGQDYMKLAVDVGRRIYKDKPEVVHYQQFSNSTEVTKLT